MSDPIPVKSGLRANAARIRARAQALNPLAGETAAALFPIELLAPDAVVAGYWPFRSEIDPRPLLRRLARLGATPALPVTPAKGADAPLSFRTWREDAPLSRSAFGVHEPDAAGAPVEPDLLFIPLLAFDDRGHRLGYGAGHYDRTLARLKTIKPVTAVGLAFAAQQVARLPEDPHDEVLDGVLTERGYSASRRDI